MATDPLRSTTGTPDPAVHRSRPALAASRLAQRSWAARPLAERLSMVRSFRGQLAERAASVAVSGPRSRTDPADSLTSEILPLLEACRWLEDNAEEILSPRRLAGRSPYWLGRSRVTVHRDPHGLVLVIGPSNYPIFLPGVQIVQALAAGNAVVVKPGTGGGPAARWLRRLLEDAGLDSDLCVVLDENPASANWAIDRGIDKVVLTGSTATGRAVLSQLADTLTPATMELSGSDAAYILPGADLGRVAAHLAFGATWNAGATCIAPRRVFVTSPERGELAEHLERALRSFDPLPLGEAVVGRARALVDEAISLGGTLLVGGPPLGETMTPTVLVDVPAEAEIVGADLFAPVLVLDEVTDMDEALAKASAVPYALGASVFGPELAARRLAGRIDAGTVVVNDLIVPTADPRAPFAARRGSGFGVTRGAEGLLALTRIRTEIVRPGRRRAHLAARPRAFGELLLGYARLAHANTWRQRLGGAAQIARALLTRSEEPS